MTEKAATAPHSDARTFLRILYRAALPAMPLGLALWLVGMSQASYAVSVSGLLVLIAGGFVWQDDQHPAHPSN